MSEASRAARRESARRTNQAIRRTWLSIAGVLALVAVFSSDARPYAILLLSLMAGWIGILLVAQLVGRFSPNGLVSIEVDATGVRVRRRNGKVEAIVWNEVTEVGILTTDGGPLSEDVFMIFCDSSGPKCAVPQFAWDEHALFERVGRLPGFRADRALAAMGSTTHARFVCWQGRPGEALVAASEPPDDQRVDSASR